MTKPKPLTKDEWVVKMLSTLPPLNPRQREEIARLTGSPAPVKRAAA